MATLNESQLEETFTKKKGEQKKEGEKEANKKKRKRVPDIEGINSPCSNERCGYCSSSQDSIFKEDDEEGPDKDPKSFTLKMQPSAPASEK